MNVVLPGDIVLNSSTIEVVQSIKCLGVHFDHDMTWRSHVDFLIGKLSQVLGVVYSFRYLPQSVKLLIYNSLFSVI